MPIDDFDTQIQVEELIPEWYEDWERYSKYSVEYETICNN